MTHLNISFFISFKFYHEISLRVVTKFEFDRLFSDNFDLHPLNVQSSMCARDGRGNDVFFFYI